MMRTWVLATALAATTAGAAAAAPRLLFSCAFGAKQVIVSGDRNLLTYRFGPPGRPELAFGVAPASGRALQHRWDDGRGRAFNTQLRLVNGRTSYVVYHRESFGNAVHDGAEDYSGLLVLDGTRRIANLRCKSGPGFTGASLDSLPDDADEAFHLANFLD